MRANLQRVQDSAAELDQAAALFLEALNELSQCHGIGLTGGMNLFLMECDDYERKYTVDVESRVEFV
jgi:hypothetical protein